MSKDKIIKNLIISIILLTQIFFITCLIINAEEYVSPDKVIKYVWIKNKVYYIGDIIKLDIEVSLQPIKIISESKFINIIDYSIKKKSNNYLLSVRLQIFKTGDINLNEIKIYFLSNNLKLSLKGANLKINSYTENFNKNFKIPFFYLILKTSLLNFFLIFSILFILIIFLIIILKNLTEVLKLFISEKRKKKIIYKKILNIINSNEINLKEKAFEISKILYKQEKVLYSEFVKDLDVIKYKYSKLEVEKSENEIKSLYKSILEKYRKLYDLN